MEIFVTGSTGWIGSAAVDELLAAGHRVTGLARSDASAASLEAKGAAVLRGDLDDLDSIRRGAAAAEATIHLANKHDFAHPHRSDLAEYLAVEAIGEVLAGSDRPFLLASGLMTRAQGRPATEDDTSPFPPGPEHPRGGSEALALGYVERGVRTVSVRFAPTTHGVGDHGFIAAIAAAVRATGVSGYPGDGASAWSAVHRSDAARLVRLALELAPAGSRVHAVGETSVTKRAIAEALGAAYGVDVVSVPEEQVIEHFGPIGRFFGMDMTGTSGATRRLLGWAPAGPGLLADIAGGAYGGQIA
jgi:nucleoside-diphosphate-sugar epimerase